MMVASDWNRSRWRPAPTARPSEAPSHLKRLSPQTSGSAKRREHQRRKAEENRAEGERLARERREQIARERLENQRMALDQLSSYEPWGRAGGGAPNPLGVRYSDLRAEGIFPEDEIKGISRPEAQLRWHSQQRRRRGLRLREDPQLCYADALRRSVDNDIRYRCTPDQQHTYKEILDEMVDKRKRALKEETKRNQEYERKMQAMEGPWGRPGPGGTTWRNPRNIGLNFNKSMGWTTNEMFNKIKGDHGHLKRSSLTLPKVKRDDDVPGEPDKEWKPSNVEKLPDIRQSNSASGEKKSGEKKVETESHNNSKEPESHNNSKKSNWKKEERPEKEENSDAKVVKTGRSKQVHKKKGTFVKRLPNGERVKRLVLEDSGSDEKETEKKPTPETTILRLTGGIELVPLLARKRRVGARTLPSSDVTRPPEQPCQWRQVSFRNADFLEELKRQIESKYIQKEESRKNSAESVRQHHETWASLWGRPGHGAPQQRGRYARTNLAHLLYVAPLAHAP